MAIYLKEFQTVAEYNAAKDSFLLPHISSILETSGVTYNPQLTVNNAVITCDSKIYNASAQVATNIVVVVDDKTLVENTDYVILGNTGWVNAGNYSFTVKGINNYKGSKNGIFVINKVTPTVVIPVAKALTYQKGVAQELVTAGSTDWGTMKYSLDNETYSTSVPSRTRASSYTVYYFVEGDSNVNSTEVATVACSINEKPVTATIELSQDTYTYDGTAKEPTVTVKDGGDIIDPSEYTVTYSNNTNAGTASVTITDNTAGDYNVSGVTTFTINKASRTITFTQSASTLDVGSTTTVAATVSAGDGTITYSSSDTTKATVNGNIVSGVGVGSCTITATISQGTNYNAASTSYTLTVNDPYVGHAYVDLGLPSGTKWATMNIGASSETSYGNYYQYGKGASQYAATSGQSDYSGTENPLNSSVDTARQTWGGSWHMPTLAQMQELTANTTYTWETINGVNGGKFTAQNGNYIFIPAAGRWSYGSHRNDGSLGYVWSSSPDGSRLAFGLSFNSGGKGVNSYVGREYGCSVRPVVG